MLLAPNRAQREADEQHMSLPFRLHCLTASQQLHSGAIRFDEVAVRAARGSHLEVAGGSIQENDDWLHGDCLHERCGVIGRDGLEACDLECERGEKREEKKQQGNLVSESHPAM